MVRVGGTRMRGWGSGIYPLGLGANRDETLLDDLGQRSGGMPAAFAQRPADIFRIFQEQVHQTAAVAVRLLPIVDDLGEAVRARGA